MESILGRGSSELIVLLMPVLLLGGAVVGVRFSAQRDAGVPLGRASADGLAAYLFLVGVATPLIVTLAPTSNGGGRALSLVPLRELLASLTSAADGTTALRPTLGNIVLFFPLGLSMGLRGAGGRRTVALSGAFSVMLEAAQWITGFGRVASVDDVLLNTLGALAGVAVALTRKRMWAHAQHSRSRGAAATAERPAGHPRLESTHTGTRLELRNGP